MDEDRTYEGEAVRNKCARTIKFRDGTRQRTAFRPHLVHTQAFSRHLCTRLDWSQRYRLRDVNRVMQDRNNQTVIKNKPRRIICRIGEASNPGPDKAS
eukprot:11974377-Heterocapsa_arctica.AAC.1